MSPQWLCEFLLLLTPESQVLQGRQVIELPGLRHLHATVFLAPAIVALLGDSQLTADLTLRLTTSKLDLGLAKKVDDLLGLESSYSHRRTPWSSESLSH